MKRTGFFWRMSCGSPRMRRFLFSLLFALPNFAGCYLAHDIDGVPFDPAVSLPPAPADSIAPGTCRVEAHGRFVVPGAEDVSSLQITAVGSGFFGLYERRGPLDASEHPNFAVAGMLRGDVVGMAREREIGDYSLGLLQHPTLERGDDGRLAVCVDAISARFAGTRPGAVAFLTPDGALERMVPVARDCADVAFVAGRWVVLEVDASAFGSDAQLSIFDATLAVTASVPLGRSDVLRLADRVVAFGDHALVLMAREEDDATLVLVDLDSEEVLMTQTIDVDPSNYDLAVYGDEAHVFAATMEGGLEWRSYDANLERTFGPTPVLDYEVVRALTLLPDGIAMIADHTFDAGDLLLLDPSSHEVFSVDVPPPAEVTSAPTSWFDVGANRDYVLVSSWSIGPTIPWTWGARCKIQ